MYKVAVVGNTKLTELALRECLIPHMEVVALFSLNKDDTKNKTNGVDLSSFCDKHDIFHLDNGDWDNFNSLCIRGGVRTIFVLGDSRIIPKRVINNFPLIIGNHGAILPDVKGGASLVWGRMINNGQWGVSLFKIQEGVDTGPIFSRKSFEYNDISMDEFVTLADKITVDLLKEICHKLINNIPLKKIENQPWSIKIAKHTDSQQVCKIADHCLNNEISVYLPPRNLLDSYLREEWGSTFKENFKAANNIPYPKWSSNE